MARRRHYRGLRGLVRFPGLSGLKLPQSVKPVDVAVGMGLGLLGGIGLNKGLAAAGVAVPSGIPTPVLGGLASAAVLYFAEKKSARGAGHAVGAALGGLIVWGYGMVAATGALGDLRTLPGGYGAPIFDNPRNRSLLGYGGPIFDNPNLNLGRLAQLQGMGDDNEDGMTPAP